jgi:hypothetical protein
LSPLSGPKDPWALPTVLLWCLFFAAGLDPEVTFLFFRDAGRVVTQNALVNSPHIVTLALAGFLAAHVYWRCRDAKLSVADAQARALQTGVLGLAAFLNFALQDVLDVAAAPTRYQRLLLISVGAVKYGLWMYLFVMVVRFHLFKRQSAFTKMVSVFPSTYGEQPTNGKSASLNARSDDDHVIDVTPSKPASEDPGAGN